MPFNKYIGRTTDTIIITKNEDVDLSNVVKYQAVLLTDTPVRVAGELLELKDDEACDTSFWPYVNGQILKIRFDETNPATKNLQLTLVKLVPNPNYCE